MSLLFNNLRKTNSENLSTPQSRSFERWICDHTQDLQIFKKFNMSQMNQKEIFHNTAYSVQLPYIALLPSLEIYILKLWSLERLQLPGWFPRRFIFLSYGP